MIVLIIMSYFLTFVKILRNFAAISKFRGKKQIPLQFPWLGSKFHSLRKTVGPNDEW